MKGYFQRLLARSASSRAEIHPLLRLPQAAAFQSDWVPADLPHGDWLPADAPETKPPARADSAAGTARSETPARAQAAGAIAHDAALGHPQHATEEERTKPKTGARPTVGAMPTAQFGPAIPQAEPPPYQGTEPNAVAVRHSAPPLPAMPLAAAQPESPDRAPPLHEDTLSQVAFRLMPDSAQHAAAAPAALSLAPTLDVTQARMQAAHLTVAPGQAPRQDKTEVHVSIGRIEVTAWPAAAAPKRAPRPAAKAMSLDEYLHKRQQERA